MKKLLLQIAALTALLACTSSCKDLTHVQTGYVSDRDDCQARANYGLSTYTTNSANVSGKDRSSMQSQLFCECMKDHEWSVAGCKFKDIAKITPAPQQQQPTIVVVQSAPPAAVVAAPPAAEPLACPAPPKGKKRAKRRLDGTCPAPEEYSQTELDNVLNKQ